jgi:hypothetical protein
MEHLEALVAAFIEHTDKGCAESRQAEAELRHNLEQGRAESRQAEAEHRRNLEQGRAESRQAEAELRYNLEQGRAESRQAEAELRRNLDATDRKLEALFERIDRDIAGMELWRIQSQKQWGEIAQKLGSFVEDIVAPNIPRLAREIFRTTGPADAVLAAARLRVSHPGDRARMREFDYIYATAGAWMLVESKNDPKLKDVDSFREMLAEAKDYFPQYAALPLYPVFASLSVPDHVVKYCTRHRIYALGLGPETMQLLNLAELSAG